VFGYVGVRLGYGLEWDHDDPVANDGLTSYENLVARCKPDHWAKTERDRKAGLLRPGRKRAPPGQSPKARNAVSTTAARNASSSGALVTRNR
jgi:hypothetical protein